MSAYLSGEQSSPRQPLTKFSCAPPPLQAPSYTMALVSADSRIAELLTELHQLIKQTQVKNHSLLS